MRIPRGLTSWLLFTCIFLIAALFTPLEWPNIIILTAHVATLVAIGWMVIWFIGIQKFSIKLLVLALTALIALCWLANVYFLLTGNDPETSTALGPTPGEFFGSLLTLVLLGFTTFLTIRFHLGDKPPTTDE